MAKGKTLKRVLMGLGVLVVAGACAVYFAAPVLLEKVVAYADETSRRTTGRPLVFSSTPTVSLFPLGVRFEGLRWGDEKSDIYVSAKSGSATVSTGSLFGGTPQIREVHLESPVVRVNRDAAAGTALGPAEKAADGEAPAEQMRSAKSGDGGASAAASPSPATLPVELDRLVIQNGEVTVTRPGGDKVGISKLNLSVRNVGQGRTGEVESDFVASLREAGGAYTEVNLALQGKVLLALPRIGLQGVQLTLTPVSGLYDKAMGPMGLNVRGAFDSASGALSLEQFVATLGTGVKVALTGSGALGATTEFAGELAVEAFPAKVDFLSSLAGVSRLGLQSKVGFDGAALSLSGIDASADKAALKGDLKVALDPMAVTGALALSDLDVDALLAGGRTTGASSRTTDRSHKADKASAANADKDAGTNDVSSMPAVDLVLTGGNIRVRGLDVDGVNVAVKGEKGRYTVRTLKATVDGQAQLDASATANLASMAWTTRGSLNNLTMAIIQKLAGRDMGLSGTSAASWNVRASGSGADAILRSAAGDGRLSASNVGLPGMTRAIRATSKLAGVKVPERVDSLNVPFTLGGGKCHWNATLKSNGLDGKGNGTVDLVAQRVDARVELDLDGKLVPLKVNGPLSDISCTVDAEALLKNAGKDLLRSPGKAGEKLEKLPQGAGRMLKGLF